MIRQNAYALSYTLLLWQLSPALTSPCAGSCLPTVTWTREDDTDRIQSQQHMSLSMHRNGLSFRIQDFPCVRDGPCCSRNVYVTQGQHDDLSRGLKLGVERSNGGSSFAFLTNMHWKPKHILLSSCHAFVEAAAIHLASPNATLFCLPSDIKIQKPGTDKGQSLAWQKGLMHVDVRPTRASRKLPHKTEEASDLSISWKNATPNAIPAAPDMTVIPAEGEGSIQALETTLLHDSYVTVSQHLISHLSANSAEELATAPSQIKHFLHMHISGWELYAREPVVSLEQPTLMARPARGGVKIAYHMTAIGRGPAIAQEHFGRLMFSGLYDVVEGIYCFILGPSDVNIEGARRLMQRFGRKVIIAGTSTDMTQYERFTLLGIRAYLRPGDIVLYMHSKGLRHDPSETNISDWSFYMMYFLVRQYSLCLRLLSKDFDICGVDFHREISPHFSGNFFWASAQYYLSLPDSIGPGYIDPEMYIGSGSPRHVALWEANSNFYDNEYPPLRFVDSARIALAWQGWDTGSCVGPAHALTT